LLVPDDNRWSVRKLGGVIVAAILLGAAAVGSNIVEANRTKAGREWARGATEASRARAREALAAHVAQLELEVKAAAANQRLVTALRGRVDRATLEDLFRSEQWWEPFRAEFKLYAIAVDTELRVVQGGMKGSDLSADHLVRQAREQQRPISEVALGKGLAYVAAATTIATPERAISPVLVLAKAIDDQALKKLADATHGAVLLSDGQTALAETGNDAERELLRGAVGSERRGPHDLPAAGGGAAGVDRVAPGLWMWTYASVTAQESTVGSHAAMWGAAGFASLVGLLIGFARRPEARREGSGPVALVTSGNARSASEDAASVLQSGGHPGQTFGRYRLLDRLGSGGMAEVFTAVTFGAEGFRRTFVVKRLHAEIARHPAAVKQFIDEANLGSTLVHSNIVPIFDFGNVGNEYFLAQEYILGRDLGRITARLMERGHKPLPAPLVLYVARETCKALEYAHSKLDKTGRPLGIVHRDVTPENVLVSALGEVKLLDFGIVKADGRVSKTQDGLIKGTPKFMAPEQARAIAVDARADVFSLGLVMFYCLTGETLYAGDSIQQALLRASQGPGDEELARLVDLPYPFPAILLKALRADPAGRYQSAAELGAALSPHVKDVATELVRLMRDLFGPDLRQEEAHFAAVEPPGEAAGGDRARRSDTTGA
jgi:hypothetical protein